MYKQSVITFTWGISKRSVLHLALKFTKCTAPVVYVNTVYCTWVILNKVYSTWGKVNKVYCTWGKVNKVYSTWGKIYEVYCTWGKNKQNVPHLG